MMIIQVNRYDLENAVRDNKATPDGETFLHPTRGFTFVGRGFPYRHDDPENLVPIPAMDPEGDGMELERFYEFSESPPEGVEVASYRESSREYLDREDWFDLARAAGWDTVETDWEAEEKQYLAELIGYWKSDPYSVPREVGIRIVD
jgi:hypothetical protein